MNIEDRDELVLKVADFTNSDPEPLKPVLGNIHVSSIPTHNVPLNYANNVVIYCERSGWIEQPAFVNKVSRAILLYTAFNQIQARLLAAGPPKFHAGLPWDTCLLALKLPFLNREKTRRAIKLFLKPLMPVLQNEAGARVLVVNGPPKSGKSFTLDYIKYIGALLTQENCGIAVVDYSKQMGNLLGPVELIRILLNQILPVWDESSIPILEAQQPSRWLIELVNFLIIKISETERTWFLVLDGFESVTILRSTIEFILRLADITVGANNFGLNIDVEGVPIRLVLLGFKDMIPNHKNRVISDNIEPIQKLDIQRYFERYVDYKGIKNVSSSDIDEIANGVMESIPDSAISDQTKLISEFVTRVAEDLDKLKL